MNSKLICILFGALLIGLLGLIHITRIEEEVNLAADGSKHHYWKYDGKIYFERHYYPSGQLESELRRDENNHPLWYKLWNEAGYLEAYAYEKNYVLVVETYDEQGNVVSRYP